MKAHRPLLACLLILTASAAPALAITELVPPLYTIYFDHDDAGLDTEDRAALDVAVSLAAGRAEYSFFKLQGGSDSLASEAESRAEAELWTQRVVDYLVSKGIPSAKIKAQWHGEDWQAVQTGDGISEPMNRRIIIEFYE